VPGCILTVVGTAASKGELSRLFEFSEDEFITPPDDGEEGDDSKKDK
jgi:hypothetical protein